MDYLIYAVYVILPIVLLFGAKVYGKGEWNDQFLSLEQSKAIQGFLAVCIMFHHVGQKTCASWINPPTRIQKGLEFFVPLGFMFVAVFFFFNGYGVYKSFHSKENYLKGFIGRRILPIILALYSTTVIYFVVRLIIGQKMKGNDAILYLTSIKLCNPYTWYVIVLPFFYLFFYLCFKLIKHDGLAVALVTAFVVGYILFGTTIDHNDFWIRGEWWYNCVALFPVGVIFAKFEKALVAFFKKTYVVVAPLTVAAVLPVYFWSREICNKYGYYGDNWGNPDTVLFRRYSVAAESAICIVFVLALLLIGMKVQIGNKFLKFMGGITLEFYLIHGIFVELCAYNFDGGVKSPFRIHNLLLYSAVVFALGIPSALLLKKFHSICLRKDKKIQAKAAA
jgi:membrane-bound acyltransferase YfiQ involved in biofilm formation